MCDEELRPSYDNLPRSNYILYKRRVKTEGLELHAISVTEITHEFFYVLRMYMFRTFHLN